jgi:hypothetical protein
LTPLPDQEVLLADDVEELPPFIEHRLVPELTEAGEEALVYEQLGALVRFLPRYEIARGKPGVVLIIPESLFDRLLNTALGATASACPYCGGLGSQRLSRLCLWPGHEPASAALDADVHFQGSELPSPRD